MGGYSSGGHNRRLITVENCARIDVAMLRRAGLIQPAAMKDWQTSFSRRGTVAAVLLVLATPEVPDALHFTLVIPDQGKHSQIVPLSFTPCTYGKDRAWLHCPKCQRRVFRLFYYDNTWSDDQQVHYFACRHCYGLTYDLRRSRGFDYYQAQTIKAGEKLKQWALTHQDWQYLKDAERLTWDTLPRKPRGMRWTTYSRIADKFVEAQERSEGAFVATLGRLLDLDRDVKRL